MSQHSNHNLYAEEFKRVPYRKRSRKAKNNQVETFSDDFGDDIDIDKSSALRRIESAIEEISSSDVFDSAFASLREGLGILENPEVREIYCLGLGHIGERLIPRYQLALLICLKEKFDAKIFVHDPIFHPVEKEILTGLGLTVLEENQEGKYTDNKVFRMNPNIQLLRQLISELRNSASSGPMRENLAIRYILDQFRKYKTTEQQLCKAQEEMKFTANAYLCYLKSMRKYTEINQNFHGKGERSIRETADMVGFKLPHDPK